MKLQELQERLLAEGCNQSGFSITPWGGNNDVDVLEKNNGIWEIYFTERGSRNSPIATFENEAEACEYYYNRIIAREHRHLIGCFEDEEKAIELQSVLEEEGISYGREDRSPYRDGSPIVKVVFVLGVDIFKVRELYGKLPLSDYEY